MAKNRKTAQDFGGKTQTASYYWNRKTALRIGKNRKTARKKRRKPQNRTKKSTKTAKPQTSDTPPSTIWRYPHWIALLTWHQHQPLNVLNVHGYRQYACINVCCFRPHKINSLFLILSNLKSDARVRIRILYFISFYIVNLGWRWHDLSGHLSSRLTWNKRVINLSYFDNR